MSSLLRTYAQIPARAKYFLWLEGGGVNDEEVPATSIFRLTPGAYTTTVGSMATATKVMTNTGFDSDVTPTQNLLKDMGRQITVYDDSTKLHLAVYREVQIVNGVDTEGVGGALDNWDSTIFVKVWDAAGNGVNVVRTG